MRKIADRQQRNFARWAVFFRSAARLFCKVETHASGETIDFNKPLVVVANHRSFFDVLVGFSMLNDLGLQPRILVRDKFFDSALPRRFLTSTGCIPAGRDWRSTIDAGIATLANGKPVGVMIEGRIVPPEDRDEHGLGKIRRGFVEIARSANAGVLPIAVEGTDEVWPLTKRLPRLRLRNRPKVHIGVGRIVSIDGLTTQEAMSKLHSAIANQLAQISSTK